MAFWTRARITIRGLAGDRQIAALRLGDWAVHRNVDKPEHYLLTLLPLGLCLPPNWCSFARLEDAARAAAAIARMRNSWAQIVQADLTLELAAKLREIAVACGAVRGPTALTIEADHSPLGLPLTVRPNGYATLGA
jgi:hypothetical protein